MDVQLKRGILEICVLSVLIRGDSYGYQIIKDMKPYLVLSELTLYGRNCCIGICSGSVHVL